MQLSKLDEEKAYKMNKEYSMNPNSIKQREYRKKHPELIKRESNRRRKTRLELMQILGPLKCVNCGFNRIEALQIDHIDGFGYQERRIFFKTSFKLYRFYLCNPELAKKNLQILCANCNIIKSISAIRREM